MAAKPIKVAFLGDESDLTSSLSKAGGELDGFAADAQSAGSKAEAAMAGVGDKADAVGSASSQAAGGIGDLGGALALMPGPLGAVGAGMEAAAPAIMGVTGAADLLNLATTKFPALAKAQTVATNVMAGAQKALNAVMAGNPIALVVLAIVTLIAILGTLYAKNEAFRELVDKVFGAFKTVVGEALGRFKDFASGTIEKIGGVIGKFGDFRERIAEGVAAAREKLQSAGEKFGDLREAARNAIGQYGPDGGGVLGKVHDIVSAVGGLPGIIRDKAAGVFGPVRDAAVNAIGQYGPDGGGVLGKVHDIASAVGGLPGIIREKAAGVFGPVRDAAVTAIGTYGADGGGVLGKLHDIVSTLTGLGGTITEKASGMWNGIGSSFKGVINQMIGWWNNLSFSIDIPDKIPGLPDSFTISTPNIPYLADGGIVNRATLAVIGEAGPEAVIPLDRLGALGGGKFEIDLTLSAEAIDGLVLGRHYKTSIDTYTAAGGR